MTDILAPIIRHLLHPLWMAKQGSGQRTILRELETTQYRSRDELNELQLRLLRRLLQHAYADCPFYRARFDSAGMSPDDITTFGDFSRLPILSKEEIQGHYREMISTRVSIDALIPDKTGGSTGSPLVFYYDRERLDSRHAATLRHNRWAGWDIGDKVALLWGAVRDIPKEQSFKDIVRRNLLERSMILDASSITTADMDSFALALARFRPKIILAYANTMGLFADFVLSEGISDIRPAGIVTSAEVLTDETREKIERAFQCKVFNRYGCREFAIIASECERHRGMHINAENLYVECVETGSDDSGDILVTDLRNFAMPLIRYRIGDKGMLSDSDCDCGRGLPLLEKVVGRETDFIHTPEGKLVSGVAIATFVITNIPGIAQVQMIQNSIDSVVVKVIENGDSSVTTLSTLEAKLRELLGDGIKLSFERVSSIPVASSGKYRFTISNIEPTPARPHGQPPLNVEGFKK